MTNHPKRARPPVDLAGALRADLERTGETRAEYARRRGVSKATLDKWLDRPATGALASLLADEITARLSL